jgi:hypothetical protein
MDVHLRDAVASSGERTRLACWRARPAIANFAFRSVVHRVRNSRKSLFRRDAETSTRGRVRSPEYATTREVIRRVFGGIVRARILG